MGLLSKLLSPSPRRPSIGRPRYLPFSEPSYRGGYHFLSGRGTSATTNALLSKKMLLLSTALPLTSTPLSKLSYYEDRRRWTPDPHKTALTTSGPDYILTETLPDPEEHRRFIEIDRRTRRYTPFALPGEPRHLFPRPGRVSFANPLKTIICLKRQMRREVMNALGLAGLTGFKTPKFNPYSRIKC